MIVARSPTFIAALPAPIRFFLTRRFATFLVFGGLAALVNLVVGRTLYTLPVFTALLPYWVAVVIGSACGLLVNFGLNFTFNFRYQGRPAVAQLQTFVVVALGGVGLTALIASGALHLAGWAGFDGGLTLGDWHVSTQFLAHVVATGLVTFYSFAAHSALSFNSGLRAFIRRQQARCTVRGLSLTSELLALVVAVGLVMFHTSVASLVRSFDAALRAFGQRLLSVSSLARRVP